MGWKNKGHHEMGWQNKGNKTSEHERDIENWVG